MSDTRFMEDTLERCLEDLENRLDPEQEERLAQEWRVFSAGGFPGDIFSPRRDRPIPPQTEWQTVRVNAALENPTAMLLQQYGICSSLLNAGSGLLLHVRSNYGTSILPLLFGVEPFVMSEEMDTLPTSRPLNDSAAIRRLLDAGLPDLTRGYAGRVTEVGERFVEIARRYPKIGRYVHPVHPDLQGPLDVCEVLWGSSLFTALYDQPDTVHALLDLITRAYEALMRRWERIAPFSTAGNCHWGFFHRGSLMIHLDSAMNLSRKMVEEFALPYDRRLLESFGGGAIHFCGRGDHFIGSLCALPGLYAINLTQPHLNHMERIFSQTVDRGINLLGLERPAAEEALRRGRALHGRVHCS
jgi:hypothetical protein